MSRAWKDHTQIAGHDTIGTPDFAPPPAPPPPYFVDVETGERLERCPQCGFLYLPFADWPMCRGEGGPAAHKRVSMLKFSEFDFDADEGTVRISSIHQLRKLERESLERFKAGQAGDPRFKGARPYVFRQYSQDPSNKTKRIDIVPDPEPRGVPRGTRRGKPFRHPSYRMRED